MKKNYFILYILIMLLIGGCKFTEPESETENNNNTTKPSPTSPIKVVSPNGGEVVRTNGNFQILWTSQDIKNVDIYYSITNGPDWIVIAKGVESKGIYNWTNIPSIATKQARVMVMNSANEKQYGISENNFEIANEQVKTLTVVTPNGGESFEAGTFIPIAWNSSGISTVKIEYSVNNGNEWITIVSGLKNTGSYEWKVPENITTQGKIRVSEDIASDPRFDESDKPFSIILKEVNTIKVVSPRGGELLRVGANFQILWTSKDVEHVKIEYSLTNGPNWILIADNVESKGAYTWFPIPNTVTKQGRVRVTNTKNAKVFAISDANFEITNIQDKSLSLVYPNGGESFESGTIQTLRWNSSGIENVKLEYSLDNGASWKLIGSGLKNVGNYEWRVPEDITVKQQQCKIRISEDLSGTNLISESARAFEIKPKQKLAIVQPLGNSIIKLGEPYEIKWTSTGIDVVNIDYAFRKDPYTNDWVWETIAKNYPNSGSIFFNFSDETTQLRIRIADAEDGSPVQIAGPLTIKSAAIKRSLNVVKPNGDENWYSLSPIPYEIRWQASDVEFVKIEYTLDQKNWKTIVERVPNNGTYQWKVPTDPNLNISKLARVRISDADDPTLNDISDNDFSIYFKKYIRLKFPNGAQGGKDQYINTEVIKSGVVLIDFESIGITQVRLEISLDNGTTWHTQATKPLTRIPDFPVEAKGYAWRFADTAKGAPNEYSGQARIRIYDAADANVNSQSASYFYLNVIEGSSSIVNDDKNIDQFKPSKIEWVSDKNIKNVNLEYSDDNGKTWKLIKKDLKSNPGKNSFDWNDKPKFNDDKVKIRLVTPKNEDIKEYRVRK